MTHTILSVDGDSDVRGSRAEILRQAGFEVVEACSAVDGLNLALELRPAAIIVPTELPGTDGFTLATRLKADPRTAAIPVLHISNGIGARPCEYTESLKSGAGAFLQEPTQPELLNSVIKALIEAAAARFGPNEPERLANDRLSALIDSIPDEIWFADTQRRVTLANPSARREFDIASGASPGLEDLARNLEIYRADGSPRTLEEAPPLRALRGETVRDVEEIVRTPGHREMRHRQVSASPVKDANGNIAGAVAVVRDVTDTRRAEQALRESQSHLQLFVQHAPAAIAMFDLQMRYIAVSRRWMTDFSLGERSCIGRSHYDVFPEIPDRWKKIHRRCLAGAVEKCDEDSFLRADGQLEWLRWDVHPWRDAKREIGGIIIFTEVITDRKRAEIALRASEERYRTLFETMAEGFALHEIVCDAAGLPCDARYLSVNPAFERQIGRQAEEILGRTIRELFADAEPVWFEQFGNVALTGETARFEARFGTIGQWFEVSAFRTEPGRFGAVFMDITERQRAQEALRESEERFRAQVTASSDVVYRMNPDWSEMRRLDGRDFIADTEEPSRGWLQKYIHPDDQPLVLATIEKAVRTKSVFQLEHQVLRPDGTLGWTFSRAVPQFNASGEIVEWFGAASDITERKQAEEALRQSEKMYRAIGESIDYGVWQCDPDGRNTYASESFLSLVGLTQEQCSSFGWADVLHPDDVERTIAAWRECVRTEGRWDIEHRFRGVDGEWHPMLARGVPVRDERGEITSWVGINLDIGALKRTEQSLRESESRERARAEELETLMDAAPAAIFIAEDAECGHVTGNRTAYDLVRMPPGSNLAQLAPDGERPPNFRLTKNGIAIPPSDLPVKKAAATGQPVRDYEYEVVLEDGTAVNLLGNAMPLLDRDGQPRGAVGVFVDITGRRHAEERLRHSQKLESLGLMAGGVAHDFNNLLVGVIGNASLARDMLPFAHPAGELLEGVLRAGEQAAHLTRQMLAYAGKGRFLLEALNLSELIPEIVGLVRPSISKKIALNLDLTREIAAIQADRGQVQQVFMNLALNAAESIGQQEGAITIKTGVLEVSQRYLRLHPEAATLPPGKYVSLEVRDTGCGMDDATRAKIFDPFFSTKFTGRGLGLAAVAGILRSHKGGIVVTSTPGKGSCFTVLFAPSDVPAERRAAAVPELATQSSGVVLVVDDEKAVRDLVKTVLERRGYTVLLAESGLAAIDLAQRQSGEIALVVLDLSMPNMGGEETLPELRKLRPNIKVLVSSGYSEAETMTFFNGQQVAGFIQKPFTGSTLAEKVKGCIG
jgi:PAS domain S-box-containing protein